MRKFIKRVQQKWLYSVVGLWTALKEEKSLWAYLFVVPAVIVGGILLKISLIEWAVLVLAFFTMFAIEIINTTLEATVDTISFQYNVKVKKIKDIASGATLVITTGAFIVMLIIFIPALKAVI